MEKIKIEFITKLDVSNNDLRFEGTKHLCEWLMNNKTLKTLNLGENPIGDKGVRHLCDSLKSNYTLSELHLVLTGFHKDGLSSISQLLLINDTLKTLHLSGNKLAPHFKLLADSLKRQSCSLQHISVSFNNLTDECAKELSQVFQLNHSLTSVDLSGNKLISDEGAFSIFQSLQKNNSVTHLNIEKSNVQLQLKKAIESLTVDNKKYPEKALKRVVKKFLFEKLIDKKVMESKKEALLIQKFEHVEKKKFFNDKEKVGKIFRLEVEMTFNLLKFHQRKLLEAISNNDLQSVVYHISFTNPNLTLHSQNCLHFACTQQLINPRVLEILVENGVEVNAKDSKGRFATPNFTHFITHSQLDFFF